MTASTLRLYLDAVEVGSAPLSGAIDAAPSVPVTVGVNLLAPVLASSMASSTTCASYRAH